MMKIEDFFKSLGYEDNSTGQFYIFEKKVDKSLGGYWVSIHKNKNIKETAFSVLLDDRHSNETILKYGADFTWISDFNDLIFKNK